jgi:DNA-binding SARP family transcriptional activator/Tol biopolymer transport system component
VIRLRLLGSVELLDAEGRELRAVLAQPKRLALLAYLAAAQPVGFQRRDTLLALFWPELDDARARDALNQALRYLRQSLGTGVVVSRGADEVTLDLGRIRSDVESFREAVDRGEHRSALAIYRGDLLEGFFAAASQGFEEWLERERARLRSSAANAARELAKERERAGEVTAAVSAARRAVELSALDEPVVRELIALLDRGGDRAGAIQVYEAFARKLSTEYHAKPAAETTALLEKVRLRSQVPSPGAGLHYAAGVAAASHADVQSDAPRVGPRSSSASEPPRDRTTTKRRTARAAVAATLVAFVATALVVARTVGPNRPLNVATRQLTFSGNAVMSAISPNGEFVAFVVETGDSVGVVVQDIPDGSPDTLAVLFGVNSIEWSPDGTRLLIGSYDGAREHGIAIVLPRHGRQPRRLGLPARLGPGVLAYWLPAGSRVSMHAPRDRRILLLDLTTEDTVSVPVGGAYTWLQEGSWSPDGGMFAVVTASTNPVQWAIRTITPNGTTELITEDSVQLGSPRWSRDGRALLYLRGTTAISRVAISAQTGKRRGKPQVWRGELEMLPYFGTTTFSVARDGQRLVYAKGRRFSNLLLVHAPASGLAPKITVLTTGTSLRWSPVVSPNGQWIAFAQETHGAGELFRLSISGGSPTQLTFGARVRESSQIAWSPDGSSLAFETVRSGHPEVRIAAVDGGSSRALSKTQVSTSTGHLTWAPGRRVAYQRSDHRNLGLVDATTGDERLLVSDTALGFLFSPQYSPDGNRLAVAWNRVAHRDPGVWIFDLRDSSYSRVSERWLWPRGWSADGRYIFAQVYSGPTLYQVDAQGGRLPEPVLTAPFRQGDCTPGGPTRPRAFVCTAFGFVSDIWLIDNLDRRRR